MVALSLFLSWRSLVSLAEMEPTKRGSTLLLAPCRSWSAGPGERGGTVASLWTVEKLVALPCEWETCYLEAEHTGNPP